MAWSWSHTGEAYANAYANLGRLDRELLEVIYAEWEASCPDVGDGAAEDEVIEPFDGDKYEKALVAAKEYSHGMLVDAIWDRASASATCDNGGRNAWMCPYGCCPHMVPFDPPDYDWSESRDDSRLTDDTFGDE